MTEVTHYILCRLSSDISEVILSVLLRLLSLVKVMKAREVQTRATNQ